MPNTLQTGFRTTLGAKLNASDTTVTVAVAPTVTAGRMHIYSGNTHAWIKYTGVSSLTLTGVTFVSQTADPSTTVTGVTFSAGTSIELVEMHDQMIDRQTGSKVQVYTNSTTRDAAIATPENGMTVYNTADGVFNDYASGAWTTRASGAVVNASTTVAGKVEAATTAEIYAGTEVGGTGALLIVTPKQLAALYNYGDGTDGNVVISINTTLTRDMYYNNLTVNTGIILNPAGFSITVRDTLTLTGTAKISRIGNNASGQTAGGGLATGTCGACLGGTTGGAINGGNAHGTGVNPSYTNIVSAAGGTGGAGYAAGGTGATASGTRGALYNILKNIYSIVSILINPSRALALPTTVYGAAPSAGGGGGGGVGNGGTFAAGVGGGSGGNGGIIFVTAYTLVGSGTIEAVGGNAGNGADSTGSGGSTAAGGGGGGGGGSGGFITLIYNNGTPFGFVLTGGTFGTGGGGPGIAGASGSAGTTGQSVTIIV